ncbi:hypothetical protein E2C01_063559 [Portunus trituberculatus]|uniref:Secreted protein n=1 Tax=Portunus trituberculatus TaxID=210409 RepID=A0A5B7HHD4_PORTR|nr:hypothetical protein [Portunus trituberculatus]
MHSILCNCTACSVLRCSVLFCSISRRCSGTCLPSPSLSAGCIALLADRPLVAAGCAALLTARPLVADGVATLPAARSAGSRCTSPAGSTCPLRRLTSQRRCCSPLVLFPEAKPADRALAT